jgi:hypothetical protein
MNQENYSSWALGNLKRQGTNTNAGSPKPEMTKVHPAFLFNVIHKLFSFQHPPAPPVSNNNKS